MSEEARDELDDLLSATQDAEEGFETHEEDDNPYRRAGTEERELVKRLTSAARVARLHDLENRVTQEVLAQFTESLLGFLAKPNNRELTVVQGYGRISVNGATIKPKRHGRSWVSDWLRFMEGMGIGALVFSGVWSQEACTDLLRVLQQGGKGTPEERFKRIADAALRDFREPAHLRVLDPEQAKALAGQDDDDDLPDTERAIFIYSRLCALVEASMIAVRHGRSPDLQVRHMRSTLMKVIESLRLGLFETRLLALTALPHRSREPFASHLVNTAILALACARLLGLPRGHLIDLGFGALYAHMGRGVLGAQALFAHGGRDLDEGELPVRLSVASALRGRGYGSAGLLRLAIAEESTRIFSERTSSTGMRPPHPFSRLVGVCSTFDRLVNGSPWEPPRSPTKVLEELVGDTAEVGATCVRLLQDVLGKRPRGTLLRLQEGEIGLVIDGGARRGSMAVVRVFLGHDGRPLERQRLLELAPTVPAQPLEPGAIDVDWIGLMIQ